MKTCRVCQKGFEPFQPMQVVCGLPCARKVPILARKAAKEDQRKTKNRLADMLPLSHWNKLAQAAFNAWIRFRDSTRPCISCGTMEAGQWHAGHYLSRGARPELRFDEQNCHRQCSQCNEHLSGNLVRYRVSLIQRIGQPAVDRLEGHHEPLHLRRADLEAITTEYRTRLKAWTKPKPNAKPVQPHALPGTPP